MSNFHQQIARGLAAALTATVADNHDPQLKKGGMFQRLAWGVEKGVEYLAAALGKPISATLLPRDNYYLQQLDEFEQTYLLLADETSRKRYIEILLYRMLGPTRIRLALNNPDFWKGRDSVARFRGPQGGTLRAGHTTLEMYDLTALGSNLKLYFTENGIYVDFVLQQYNHEDRICVNTGDIVIDAGGCWGDTALYFAARGAEQVWVYEFLPSNIEIFRKNLSLNEGVASRIHLLEAAVWDASGLELSFDDRGSASCVAEAGRYKNSTRTLSIDDLVAQRKLPRVDFIKMDIEGAEQQALQGAAETIRRYHPKLAISVYHRPDDMVKIPSFLHELNPGYEFYLDYYTVVGDEVMLYAIDHSK